MLYDKEITELIRSDLSCIHDFKINCDTCRLRALCLPAALHQDELDSLENIIENRLLLRSGDHLYLQNQPFAALYAVLSGSIKTYTTHEDGSLRVTGCHLAGEVFGFSGISAGSYLSSAKALEESAVCEIPYDQLQVLCQSIPALQARMLQMMSRRLVEDHELAAQFLHKRPARKRIAAFVLGLSTRASRRGESAARLRLPMSRTDIGSFLGITLETVCRELAQLEKLNVITQNRRDVTILDFDELRALSCAS